MLHEVGQPMHAFDASLLAGSAIVVRRARAGETHPHARWRRSQARSVDDRHRRRGACAGGRGRDGRKHERSERRHARHLSRGRLLRSRERAPHATRAAALHRCELSLRARRRYRAGTVRTRARGATAHRRRGRLDRRRADRSVPRAHATRSRSRSTARASRGCSASRWPSPTSRSCWRRWASWSGNSRMHARR